MKRNLYNIVLITLSCAAWVSCSVNEIETSELSYKLNLKATVAGSVDPTRVDLLNSTSDVTGKTLIVSGWKGTSSLFDSTAVTYSGGRWSVPDQTLEKSGNYSFFAYTNVPSGAGVTLPSTSDGSISLSVKDITTAQEDILLGCTSVSSPTSGDVNINFSHPYSSVKFILGNAVEVQTGITDIYLDGVYATGTTTLNQSAADAPGVVAYSWTPGSTFANLSKSGLSVKTEAEEIATFVVIPQDLSTAPVTVTVTYDDGNAMKKVLSDGAWVAGYTTTYTLDKIKSVKLSFSSPSSSPTLIENTGDSKIYIRATITGAWYDGDGNIVGNWEPTSAYGTFSGLPGDGWVESDGMYYYTNGLAAGESATELFTGYTPTVTVSGATLDVDILIQAIPYNVNKTCIEAFAAL